MPNPPEQEHTMSNTADSQHPRRHSRRSFLLQGAALAGAGAAAAVPRPVKAAGESVAGAGQAPTATAEGYRETPHIRAYYDSARD
jgi:hypothetical protein